MKLHRHAFDVLSFVAGGSFVALAIAFLLAGADVLEDSRWIWPVLLLAFGVAGIAGAVRPDEEQDPED